MSTLQACDRLLWEAMRPEHLQETDVDLEKFVEGIEDTVVIHADQVPCWLSSGMLRQLHGNAEVIWDELREGAVEEAEGQGDDEHLAGV